MPDTAAHIADLAAFIQASPSSYHAAAEVSRRLVAAGSEELHETEAWTARPGRHHARRDGAVIAWTIPEGAEPGSPFRIIGAHTDSPGFKLKPRPTIGSNGWLQAGVEVYGGPLLNSWLDRELELAGRLVDRDGREHLVRTGPFLRIPQLAVHLDREVNSGLTLDRQRHTAPVFGVGDVSQADLVDILARRAGLGGGADVAGYDLLTVDSAAPARFGLDDALFAAGRMDNLTSVHAGLAALLATGNGGKEKGGAGNDAAESGAPIPVLAAFDHEELGSESRSGASGPFLADVLARITAGLAARDAADHENAAAELHARALAASWCISSDAGHAVHPNYPERHDPANRPQAGGGPLLKINANQRYATDAHGAALWHRVSAAAGVPVQEFVSNNTVPCGSTIGPLTATRLGIRVVDVGPPLLSMHSARELAHVDDLAGLAGALTAFHQGA
ncbi:M18 family aminopeptidase [Herbiconiux sp. CPCC 203407]|uniref:M18 family aminopeptidase n=1 Tax=Herbiconiux oxytropis TaxID=2970915 RepID=A0AA41XI15_9MICO|nr:M18 family aminopeptidase [Herbiconiux oxytropis]MCS5721311.1 M18 family aminopeptidase [Herbiconiux oxytropis]MCS5726250.1 M18 family aminopeptidase [Herbiconiux oxytropis]